MKEPVLGLRPRLYSSGTGAYGDFRRRWVMRLFWAEPASLDLNAEPRTTVIIPPITHTPTHLIYASNHDQRPGKLSTNHTPGNFGALRCNLKHPQFGKSLFPVPHFLRFATAFNRDKFDDCLLPSLSGNICQNGAGSATGKSRPRVEKPVRDHENRRGHWGYSWIHLGAGSIANHARA